MDNIRPAQLLMPLASLVGLTGFGNGIYSFVNPVSFADIVGIPLNAQTQTAALPYVALTGARNLASGLSVLVLIYTGQRKAVGTVLMCGVVTAVADAWICNKYSAAEGKAIQHAVMGSFIGVLGYSLYNTA